VKHKIKTLSGADYLQLLLEHHMSCNGGGTNVIRLELQLKGTISKEAVLRHFKSNKTLLYLNAIRLAKIKWFSAPKWVLTNNPAEISIKSAFIAGDAIPHEIMNESIDIQKEAGFKVWLLYRTNNTCSILFSFHHGLFDNRSVCAFVKTLSTNIETDSYFAEEKRLPFTEAVRGLYRIAKFSYTHATKEMGSFCSSSKNANRKTRVVRFSKSQSETIRSNYSQGASIEFPVAYLSALTGVAINEILAQKDPNFEFLWVPIPVDLKPKGSEQFVFGNKISFIYFKMYRDKLDSIKDTFERNISQMKYQIKERLPRDQHTFLSVYRWIPMPLYYWMFKGPSKGKLLSYTLSYLGQPFKDLKTLFGKEVLDVTNYATSPSPPGISFVFAENHGQLKLTINFDKQVLSKKEIDTLIEKIEFSIAADMSTPKNYMLHK